MKSQPVEIIIHREGYPDRRVSLEIGQTVTVGRAEDNPVLLPDIAVSRRHARLSYTTEGLVIEDLGSGNGTFYKGRAVRRQVLSDKDEVGIEPFSMSFHLPPPPEERNEGNRPFISPEFGGTLKDGRQILARLEVIAGGGLQPEYPIGSDGIDLGRSENRGVIVPDPAASRKHAEILFVGGQWLLRDGGSVNGTYVNAQRVKERHLAHGDRIRIGATEFRFLVVNEPDPSLETSGTQPFSDMIMQEQPPAPQQAYSSPAPAPFVEPPGRTPSFGAPPPPPEPYGQPGYVSSFGGPSPVAAQQPAPQYGWSAPPVAPGQPGFGAPNAAPPVQAPVAPPPMAAPYAAPMPQQLPPSYPPMAPMAAPAPYSQPGYPPPYTQASPPMGMAPGGFGSVEFAVDPGKGRKGRKLKTSGSAGRPQGTWMERNIRRLTLGIGAVAIFFIVVKAARDMTADIPSAPTSSQKTAAKSPESIEAVSTGATAEASGNVTQLLQEGNELFRTGKYVEAVEKYAQVQRVAPNNPVATRMGYHACEFLVLRSLKDALVRKSTSATEQQVAYDKAMTEAGAALSGARGAPSVSAAIDGLVAVKAFYPDDQALADKVQQLERRRSAGVVAAKEKKVAEYTSSVATLFEAAQARVSRGDNIGAIPAFQKVLDADSTRQTDFYYQAEEQIRRCKSVLSEKAREPYRQGLDALKSQDYLAARVKLREAVSIDPYNGAAQSRLREAQNALDQTAQKFWSEGEVYERSNQIQLAIGRYRKVIDYSESANSGLAKKAKDRIDRLLQ